MTATAHVSRSRHQRLETHTDPLHEHLHTVVASLEPFKSREHFARLVMVQYRLHHLIEPLYRRAALQPLLPDLPERSRRQAVAEDLTDLGVPLPALSDARTDTFSTPEAIGWLFVAEGSTLGGAVLLKRVEPLGLSETFGARHLAAHPSGRGRHWKRFTDALDALKFSEEWDADLIGGARAAFTQFGEWLVQARAAPVLA